MYIYCTAQYLAEPPEGSSARPVAHGRLPNIARSPIDMLYCLLDDCVCCDYCCFCLLCAHHTFGSWLMAGLRLHVALGALFGHEHDLRASQGCGTGD